MAIEEMELLDMTFDKKYLKEVLCQLKETKYFYPQPATKIVNNVKDVFTMTPDEDYKNMLDELKELAERVKLDTSSVKEGSIHFAKEDYRKALDDVTKEVKKYAKQPIIMKLSPNVTDITEIARAAEAGGADAVSLINTLTGMKIDINRRKFVLANKTGGMSGPAIHPVAVRMVYQTAQAVKVPIIGMGAYCDEEGNWYSEEELPKEYQDLVSEYKIMQYNDQFEKVDLRENLFRIGLK